MSKVRTVLGVAVLAAFALAVVASARLGGRAGRGTAPGSSFRADESGLLGARRVLEELGYRVESRRGAKLPEGVGHVLIRVEGVVRPDHSVFSAGPREAPAEERIAAGESLDRWVRDGNSVLLVGAQTPGGTGWPAISRRAASADAPPSAPDVVQRGVGPRDRKSVGEELARVFGDDRPTVPVDDGRDVVEVSTLKGPGDPWISDRYRIATPSGCEVLCSAPQDDGGSTPVVVECKRGGGRVVLVADPFFLSNVRLAGSDNAAWLAVLVAHLHGGGDVWFDDRAVGQAATRGVMSLFAEAGLGPAFAAAGLLVLLWWWRIGPSDAPRRHVVEDREYRPETFALVRADLYAQCLTTDDARRMVEEEVARRIGRGDSGDCRRALSMLAARDPGKAARIARALDGLPSAGGGRIAGRPHAWIAAMNAVARALNDDVTEER